MKYKKYFYFLSGTFYVILISAVIATYSLNPMDYMDNEYPNWEQQKDYIHTAGTQQQTLFLGDSIFKAAILPELFGDNAYVLALGGATSIEMHYALTEYLKNHPTPNRVFVSFSPLHYANIESYRSRNLYFHYLPWRMAIASQLEIFGRDNLPWFQYVPDMVEDAEYIMRLPTKYFRTVYDSRLRRGEKNRLEYKQVASARGHKYFGLSDDWYKQYKPYKDWLKPFVPLGSLDYYLREIIAVCKANDIEVHIVQEPVHVMDYELIEKSGYLADFQAYMSRLACETGAEVELAMPVYEVEYFGDNLHVNEAGAKRYSIELREKYF